MSPVYDVAVRLVFAGTTAVEARDEDEAITFAIQLALEDARDRSNYTATLSEVSR